MVSMILYRSVSRDVSLSAYLTHLISNEHLQISRYNAIDLSVGVL